MEGLSEEPDVDEVESEDAVPDADESELLEPDDFPSERESLR